MHDAGHQICPRRIGEIGLPRLAEALLRLDDAPPPELVAEVRRRVEEEAEKTDRLAALEHDVDLRFGVDERVRRAYLGAVSWGLTLIACGALTRTRIYPIEHVELASIGVLFLIGSIVSAWTARDIMLANATNRRVTYISVLVFGFGVVLWPLLGAVGVSMPHATVVGASVAAVLWATVPAQLSHAWRPMVVGHVLIAIGAWFVPQYHFEIYATSALAVMWTARRMRGLAEDAGPTRRRVNVSERKDVDAPAP